LEADARYTPFTETARPVITPETESSRKVDDFDHVSLEIITISESLRVSERLKTEESF
jgi:hypothetical protein